MRIASLAALTFGIFVGDLAHAGLVRVDFAGSVETFDGQIPQYALPPIPLSPAEAEAALGGSIHVGTPFTGFFIYDDSATPYRDEPGHAWYRFSDSITAHGEIGDFERDGGPEFPGGIEIRDYRIDATRGGPDNLTVQLTLYLPPAPADELSLSSIRLWARGEEPGSPLDGTTLVGIPWNLGAFPSATAHFGFWNGVAQIRASGPLTFLVPEPPAGLLIGLALLASGALGFRRARS